MSDLLGFLGSRQNDLVIAEPGKGKWETKEKKVLYIRDMENMHVLYSMRLIARAAIRQLHGLGWGAALYASSTGGEMAAMAAEEESMRAFDTAGDQEELHDYCMRQFAKYRELDAERERRGLERLPAHG